MHPSIRNTIITAQAWELNRIGTERIETKLSCKLHKEAIYA
jgi:hypothetical protein